MQRFMIDRTLLSCTALVLLVTLRSAGATTTEGLADYRRHHLEGRSIVVTSAADQKLRLTPYGPYMVRVQAVRKGEVFLPDDHYEMVQSHDWPDTLRVSDRQGSLRLESGSPDGIALEVAKTPLRIAVYQRGRGGPLLAEEDGIRWEGDHVSEAFVHDESEHFTGLGHGAYGSAQSIDLKGQVLRRNYGSEHGHQAPLIVPFLLSSRGYGVFLNSSFPNSFDLGHAGSYAFSLEGTGHGARIDFFVIVGPRFPQLLDRYTRLTGRPRLPPLSVFGLALSDKGHDHTSSTPSDETWWKRKVAEHRRAGFPLDHLVNDNRWRAGGGERCVSYFDWDRGRFPDPAEYQRWLRANGLTATLDFNRCIASRSEGWRPSFNIPATVGIEFGDSQPDLTREDVRSWFWGLFWDKTLNPALGYPGDALWIDEFDELGHVPDDMILGNGRRWVEMKNYWFFLIAKALVQEGWDRSLGAARRPFVWVRGMTAGAQRYATLWSGDIRPHYEDMKAQVRALQLAGLSGFPYWGHDAGGFYDGERHTGPDDNMYRQWAMAFGSFSPFWKPHGMGHSRWPSDRSADARRDARTYGELRYKLMPYIYSYAHEAHATGVPMARAMVVDHQDDPVAWRSDLQYMWGREILVAPNSSDGDPVSVWLPPGAWYDFWDDTRYTGNRTIRYPAPVGKLPIFVRAGSILPMADPAAATAFIRRDRRTIHIYPGKDATFDLYEDDGVTEAYRVRGEFRRTQLRYREAERSLRIAAAVGAYAGATTERSYRVEYHGLSRPACVEINGRDVPLVDAEPEALAIGGGVMWDGVRRVLTAIIKSTSVHQSTSVKVVNGCRPVRRPSRH